MEVTEVFYPHNRAQWRAWLEEHGQTKTEVWLRTFRKAANQPSLPYDDMVEECLCFGWIDGVVKKYDEFSAVQRITPRKKKSFLSELNRQRIWKLQAQGLMTPAGIEPIRDQIGAIDDALVIPDWIAARLKEEEEAVWAQFQEFPRLYQRLKIGWITETGRLREEEAQKRLNYLIKMTRAGKRYGTEPLAGYER